MATIPIKHHTKVGGVGVHIVGSVNVDYPNVTVAADVHVKLPFVGKHSYQLKCGPGHLHDEHTEKYTSANFPITVTLDIDVGHSVAYVSAKKGDFAFWTLPVSYASQEGPHRITAYGLYAVIEALKGKADHTYVIATDTKTDKQIVWNCGGAYEGGRELTRGVGDGNLCDCLSLRMEDIKLAGGMAGIRYGIDGVCHQAANRIMSPVGLVVSNAAGWNLSSSIFGVLGLNAIDGKGRKRWAEIQQQCGARAKTAAPMLETSAPEDTTPQELDAIEADFDFAALSGNQLTEPQRADLLGVRQTVQTLRGTLAAQAEAGAVSGLDLAEQLNAAVNRYVSDVARIAGAPLCQQMLGAAPEEKIMLVNADIAAQVYGAGKG
jgi:hypothetical protein